jgi:hypothetical protein
MLIRFGVQGRYFVAQFVPIAVTCAALVNWGAGEMTKAAASICSATLSGTAVVEVLMLANW